MDLALYKINIILYYYIYILYIISAERFDALASERTLSVLMSADVMQLNAGATQLGSRFRYGLIKRLCLFLSHVGWTHQSNS